MSRKLQLSSLLVGLFTATFFVRGAEGLNPRFTGTPFMRTWSADEYGAAPGNGGIVQHPRSGFIYVANAAGILEFDGIRWRLVTRSAGAGTASLTIDARGRIWFTSAVDVGCLEPDARGDLKFVSALGQLPVEERALLPLGPAVATRDGVYFVARQRVVRFGLAGGPAKMWPSDGDLVWQIWLVDDVPHVRGADGVLRVAPEGLQPVAGLRNFSYLTRRAPEGGWIMVGRDGVRRWQGRYEPVAPGLPAQVAPLDDDYALNAAWLPDGRIAFGTTRSGVVVCDRFGRRQQVIDRTHGLLSNRIEGLAAEVDGGLWVGLRNGLVRLQVDSPYARHGATEPRMETSPSSLALHDGELYVGGGEGLWRRDAMGTFHAIAGVPYLVRNLVSYSDRLFATGLELRLVEPGDRAQRLAPTCYGLVPLGGTEDIYVHGDQNGLAFARFTGGKWTNLGRHEQIKLPTAAVGEWPAGVVWAATQNAGLWRVDFRAGPRPNAPAKLYTRADGLPAGITTNNVELFPSGSGWGGIVAGRLVRYDPAADRFAPETRIAGLNPAPDGYVGVTPCGARPEPDGSLWLQLRGAYAAFVHIVPTGPDRWQVDPAAAGALTGFRALAALPDREHHTLWIGGPGALVSRDLDWQPTGRRAPPRAAIRRILTPKGELLWADGATFVDAPAQPRPGLSLPAAQNALRVVLASPAFATDHLGRAHLGFRTYLEGLDKEWTPWSAEAQRDFTNLPYRAFVLQVQARTADGRTGPVTSLPIAIAPPWWLTRWALGGYGVFAIAGVFGLVTWRTRVLRQRNEQLERTVASRTEELRRSNEELARLHALERDEKLAARLAEEKARLEVLRYQLNPHFLFNALNSVCAQIVHEPGAARSMVVRIADFCRQTLHRPAGEQEGTTIGEELEMLQAYLAIEKSRLGELLTVEIDADPATKAVRLPPLLLLPLVENAVKYGSATSPDRVGIRLRVRRAGEGVCIELSNTGCWLAAGTHTTHSTGIGLENLRQRLARHYPGAHEFTTEERDGWVTVRLRLLQPFGEHAHADHR